MSVLIVGYTYIHPSYRKTFASYPNPEDIFFLLPKSWKARGGAVTFQAEKEKNIETTPVLFHHSHYPVIGGLLKGWMPLFPLDLLRLKRGRDIQLVFSCSEPQLLTTLYNAFWTRVFGLSFVSFTWENVSYTKWTGLKGALKKIILRASLALTNGLVAGNSKAEEIHRGFVKSQITTIPLFGVDTQFFKREQREKKLREHDFSNSVVYTFAGAVAPRKGIHILIEAFAEVLKKVPNARLVIAGNNEYGDVLTKRISELAIEPNIVHLSWLSHHELRELLMVSDIFVYPSMSHGGWEEQFGYSMAEASAMELPVVATKTGSIDEVVMHEKTGLLVSPGDIHGLSKALVTMGSDLQLRERMGREGRIFIDTYFSDTTIAKKYHSFFERVLR